MSDHSIEAVRPESFGRGVDVAMGIALIPLLVRPEEHTIDGEVLKVRNLRRERTQELDPPRIVQLVRKVQPQARA